MEETFFTPLRRRRLPLAGRGRNFILCYVVTCIWLFPRLYGCSLRPQKLMLCLDVSPVFFSIHFSRIRAQTVYDISTQGNNRSNFAVRTSTTNNNNKQRSGNSHRRHLLLLYFFLSFEREIEIWQKVEKNIAFFSCRRHFPAVVTHGL